MTIHTFDSTGDAYDACQCDDTIKNGDILLIEDSQVIGLADTWPVAITENRGHLHTVNVGYPKDLMLRDCKWTAEQVRAAVALAREKGWPVRGYFTHY